MYVLLVMLHQAKHFIADWTMILPWSQNLEAILDLSQT